MTTTEQPAEHVRAIEIHDPRDLLLDANLVDRTPDQDLIDSIRELGILQAVTGYRTADGRIRIWLGHCRVLAAIEAGRLVPVDVIASEADGDDITRILGQLDENTRRKPLTAADHAVGIDQLFDLGMTADDIEKRGRIRRDHIEQARAIRASAAATAAAAARPSLTIDQAAAIAEFDTDDKAVKELGAAAEDGDGTFRHAVARLRTDRAEAEARAELVDRFEAEGITVAGKFPGHEIRLDNLTTADGKKITLRNHKKCPGRSVYLNRTWTADKGHQWVPWHFCADPKANSHVKISGGRSTSGDDLEAQRRERQLTIAGNKAWRTAQGVRREWLTGILAGKTPPKGAMRFVAESLGRADDALQRALGGYGATHETGRELLGFATPDSGYGPGRVHALGDAIAKASDGRAQVMGLALILGAYESAADVHVWRRPAESPVTSRYLHALAAWGYQLSPIERAVADGPPWTPPADEDTTTLPDATADASDTAGENTQEDE